MSEDVDISYAQENKMVAAFMKYKYDENDFFRSCMINKNCPEE